MSTATTTTEIGKKEKEKKKRKKRERERERVQQSQSNVCYLEPKLTFHREAEAQDLSLQFSNPWFGTWSNVHVGLYSI